MTNNTGSDLSDLAVRVYASPTQLLSDHTQVVGTPEILRYTDEYQQQIKVEPGQQPTAEQWAIYLGGRQYKIPVLNRRQTAKFILLTTEANGAPSVWCSVQQKGIRAEYIAPGPRILGEPLKSSIALGFAFVVLATAVTAWIAASVWIAATVALLLGLTASLSGAMLMKTAKTLMRLLGATKA